MTDGAVLVTGAGGAVGFEIVKALRAAGRDVIATYRTPREGLAERIAGLGARAETWDMQDDARGGELLAGVDAAIFTPILTTSMSAAALARGKKLLFFSSNNVAIDDDAPVYAALRRAEDDVRERAPRATILRPTMIYGYPGDGNLSVLMRAMRRFPVTPIVGAGRALQQPVFFRDLAAVAADLIDSATRPRIAAVAGPQVVTQAALYRMVQEASGAANLIAPIPEFLAGAAISAAGALGLRAPLTGAQVRRADKDKTPVGENVILGATDLPDGLRALATALDDAPAGA